jgi:hypothetical protein
MGMQSLGCFLFWCHLSDVLIRFLSFLQMKAHPGKDCNDFKAFCMSHLGKSGSEVDYTGQEPPTAYTNPEIGERIREYTVAAKARHGEEYDPCTQEIDVDLVMRQGGGKKHGRMWIANSVIDSSELSLTRIRAGSAATDPPIRPRVSSSQHQVDALQVSQG